jgi:hypothetical protein
MTGGSSVEPPDIDGSAPRPKAGAGATRPIVIYSNVPDEAEIVRILPDGSLLKKGDFICGLHSAAVDAQLANLHNTIKAAQAAHASARLAREVAELAVREYVEGGYVNQLFEVEGNIKIAEAELTLAEEDVKSIKQSAIPAAIKRAETQVLRARSGRKGGAWPAPIHHRAPGPIRSASEQCARHPGWTRPPVIRSNIKSTRGFQSRHSRGAGRVDRLCLHHLHRLR